MEKQSFGAYDGFFMRTVQVTAHMNCHLLYELYVYYWRASWTGEKPQGYGSFGSQTT